MIRAMRCLSLALTVLWVSAAVGAPVAVPELRARVTDLTTTLDAAQKQALEAKLAAFERDHGSQVAVLIVPTTQPEAIEQYSIRVVDAWKLGRAKQDDGVLLLVARDDRTLRIEVGQGLEGAIPDAIARRVIDEIILPRFRRGDFAGGIQDGVDRVLGLIRGEALPAPPREPARGSRNLMDWALPLLIGLTLLGRVLRQPLGSLPGATLTAGAAFVLVWLLVGALATALVVALVAFFVTLVAPDRTAGWSSGGGLRGGFGGGFGGGGFGGGGGGFSGGGASGRW